MAQFDDYQKNIKALQEQVRLAEQIRTAALMGGKLDEAKLAHEESILKQKALQSEQARLQNDIATGVLKLTSDEKKQLDGILSTQKQINTELTKEQKRRANINTGLNEFNRLVKGGLDYLMQSDKTIKNTILNLGLSGGKANEMRSSFEKSAGAVARIGGTLEDVQKIMEGYADETGKARVLSAQMVQDIADIGKGTGLGIENATKLGAQFEIMGFDARKTVEYVQGIVDTSERMGVNTSKVLKNINENFKKVNTFTFQKGSKGIAEMAMNAEKTKVSMSAALDVAEAARSLDKVIELGANLQVMGGEFAKMDPFEWLYTARNEPEKMTEKLSEMTKGLYTFKKMSDGTFEKFISPADRDRLSNVAQSLGIAKEEIFQIAQRRLDMDKMNQDMMGMGLSTREKELVQGAAVFNAKSAKYQVMLAGSMRDIASLTADEARSFAAQQVSLNERAKDAQTFEDAFKATINELKSALLPILRGVNAALTWIRPYVVSFTELMTSGPLGWAKVAGMFLAVGTAFKITMGIFSRWGDSFVNRISGIQKGGLTSMSNASTMHGTPSNIGNNSGAQKAWNVGQVNRMNASAGLAKAQGMRNLGTGAGIGAAALGAGAGIGAAAAGISTLADSLSKLDDKKVQALQDIVKSISWVVGIGAIAAAAIMGIGIAMGAAAAPVGAFSLAVLGIGAGIGLATAGIGYMATGLAQLVTAGKDAGGSMVSLGLGMAAISASLMGMTLGIGGLFAFNSLMKNIAKNAPDLERVGTAFKEISAVMSGNKEDYVAIQNAITAIAGTSVKGNSALSQLSNLLKTGIEVKFADKEVGIVNNITLDIDGERFVTKVLKGKTIVQIIKNSKEQK